MIFYCIVVPCDLKWTEKYYYFWGQFYFRFPWAGMGNTHTSGWSDACSMKSHNESRKNRRKKKDVSESGQTWHTFLDLDLNFLNPKLKDITDTNTVENGWNAKTRIENNSAIKEKFNIQTNRHWFFIFWKNRTGPKGRNVKYSHSCCKDVEGVLNTETAKLDLPI